MTVKNTKQVSAPPFPLLGTNFSENNILTARLRGWRDIMGLFEHFAGKLGHSWSVSLLNEHLYFSFSKLPAKSYRLLIMIIFQDW